jgi:UDP-N-acetylmuramoylalanine--D-glutamate ligase
MSALPASAVLTAAGTAVVAGLGRTGLSCVRHLRARGWHLAVTDTRVAPPGVDALAALDAEIPASFGRLDPALLAGADLVVASPGLSLDEPFFAQARAQGIDIVGDVELFARALLEPGRAAPAAGITGTNGKSTVTTLVGRMVARAGRAARVGGNLGEPALDLLERDPALLRSPPLYVLELSSFQLETTRSLRLAAATLLNLTPDHLDRHRSMSGYGAAKARIFEGAQTAVINLDDPLVPALVPSGLPTLGFSLRPGVGEYGHASGWLTVRHEPVLPVGEMKIKGLHNVANALAALATGEALGLSLPAMLEELASFSGLPHRSQWVAEVAGVTYINDSKGTNVGATIAAVQGLVGPLLVIAGGDGKGQDFGPLAEAFRGTVRHALLIGRDGPQLAAALAGVCEISRCGSLEEAVAAAARAARPGESVLLSPACASLDMFRDYTHRGAAFIRAVLELRT